MEASKPSARKRLLNAAAKLFYNNGINSTGIDSITEEAGVAKMSLYNNFSSKAELVEAYITERHHEWLDLYHRRVDEAKNPIERVLAVFDAYADHAEFEYERGFRGCGILNAAAEFPAGDPARIAVKRHKEEVESILKKHLEDLFLVNAEEQCQLAEHLSFILEGAMARAGLEGKSNRVSNAKNIARSILKTL